MMQCGVVVVVVWGIKCDHGCNHGGRGSTPDAMAALFVFLMNNSIVSEYQVAKGVNCLHRMREDMRLEVPAAPGMLDEFKSMAMLSTHISYLDTQKYPPAYILAYVNK